MTSTLCNGLETPTELKLFAVWEENFCENNFLKRPKHWLKFSPLLGPEQVSLNRQSVRIQGTTFSGEKLGILQKFPWDVYDALARWTKLLEWLSKGVRRGGENIKQSVPRSQGTPLFFYRESNLFRTLPKVYLDMAEGGTSCWRGQPGGWAEEAGEPEGGGGEVAITVSLEGTVCKVGSWDILSIWVFVKMMIVSSARSSLGYIWRVVLYISTSRKATFLDV